MSTEEWRAVPLDALRTWYEDQCDLLSVLQVAALAGVGRTTLTNFLSGVTVPHRSVRRRLALYYLREREREQTAPEAERAALGLLLAKVHETRRADIVGVVLDALEQAHRIAGAEPPAWITTMRTDAKAALVREAMRGAHTGT